MLPPKQPCWLSSPPTHRTMVRSPKRPGSYPALGDVWVLDPLDGTVNYLSGLDGFGVIVGLTRHGAPIVGGMYLPVTGDLYLAARGQGATHNGQTLQVSSTTRIEDSV